jgi:prevent-host-death family protein
MQTYTASEAREKFGFLLDQAQKSPVEINKQGRPFAVIISPELFEYLEDIHWGMKAKESSAEGDWTVEESEKFMNDLRKRNLNLAKNTNRQEK